MERVGVVVPCKNEAATIERCLASLRAQEPSPERIVVVDNGSTDGSREIAARLADDVLLLTDLRIGAMRNRGAQAVGEVDVYAFVDADCELAPGWVAAALEALETADLVGRRTGTHTCGASTSLSVPTHSASCEASTRP
jgi:glycosyltransferase involved in cell wall biosynthesis